MRNCAFFIFFRQKLSPLRRRTVQREPRTKRRLSRKISATGAAANVIAVGLAALRASKAPPPLSQHRLLPRLRSTQRHRHYKKADYAAQGQYNLLTQYPKQWEKKIFLSRIYFLYHSLRTLPKSNLGCIHRPVTRNSELKFTWELLRLSRIFSTFPFTGARGSPEDSTCELENH
jgi:hypothetical protein